MATKGIEPAKKPEKKLTKAERRQLRQDISQMSKVTPEELLKMMREDPEGIMSVGATLDFQWGIYVKGAQIKMPEQEEGVSDEEYAQQKALFDNWLAGIRKIARYWYLAGINHTKNFEQLMDILDPQNDADAPDEPKPEEQPAE